MAAGGPTGLPTFSGEKLLDLPPLLDGPRGKMSNSTTGGIIDETLNDWITSNDMWDSLGTWYDITKWAARTRNCDNASTSVVCMACAMNMPAFTVPAHVAPIAVGDELFGSPEKSATCGMCLRVYMPEDYPKCNESRAGHDPHCAGFGTHPYLRYVSKPWAWKARVESDPKLNMSYFTAIIIEWFDRDQPVPHALTYPTQGVGSTEQFVQGGPMPCGEQQSRRTVFGLQQAGAEPKHRHLQ